MSTPIIPEPIATFIERVNAHDDEYFLSAFTDDGVVDDWGREFSGREAIAAWSAREFIGSEGSLTVEEVTSENGILTVVGDWRSHHANGRSRFDFELVGDRIRRMTIREG